MGNNSPPNHYLKYGYVFRLNSILEKLKTKKPDQKKNFNRAFNLIFSIFKLENNNDSKIFDNITKTLRNYSRNHQKYNRIFLLNFLHCCYVLERLDKNLFYKKFKDVKIIKTTKIEKDKNKKEYECFFQEQSFWVYYDVFKDIIEKNFKLPFFINTSDMLNVQGFYAFVNYLFKNDLKRYLPLFNLSKEDLEYYEFLSKSEERILYEEMFKRYTYLPIIIESKIGQQTIHDFDKACIFVYYVCDTKNENMASLIIKEYQGFTKLDKKNCKFFLISKNSSFDYIHNFIFGLFMKDDCSIPDFLKLMNKFETSYNFIRFDHENTVSYMACCYDMHVMKKILKIFHL